jgi:hypothetical protein
MPVRIESCGRMSRPARLFALAIVVVAALMCLGMASSDGTERERGQSFYTCNVWNDRAWAGCP